jgi:YVTN family beta-propeller protein
VRRRLPHLAWLASAAAFAAAAVAPDLADPCGVAAQGFRVRRTERGGPRLRVVDRIETGVQPKSVALTPDERQVWVANFGRPDADNVRVYDADGLELVGTVEFAGNAVEIAFHPDGRRAYVSNFRRHTVHEIDAETLEVRREVEVGGHPKVIAVSPDGRRIYVANWASERVTELDARTFAIRRRLRTGVHPRGLAVADGGQRIFVAAMYSHLLHVFDRGARRERTSFRPCDYPRHLVLSPAHTRLYASCSCCRQVRWFEPHTYQLLGMAQTGENPRTIDLSRDGRWLAVAGFDDTTVTLVDTQELTHRIVPVPEAQQIVGVAIRGGDPLRVYATSWLTGELVVLEAG